MNVMGEAAKDRAEAALARAREAVAARRAAGEELPQLNILLSCVNPSQEGFFVPILYGMLKSFCDQYDELREQCNWLEAIMIPESIEYLARVYDFASIDVFGISCYTWNHIYQDRLAEYVRSVNPDCLIVAGGPQVEWQDPNYFETHPYVDIVIPAEGEAPWRDLLLARLDGFEHFDEVFGMVVNPIHGVYEYQFSPPLDLKTKPSPWLSMKDYWIQYFRKFSHYHLAACLETSRGCPYRCTYCDWGSKTNLRVRMVPEDVCREEIEFILGTLKPWFVFWTDANLGIAKRDVELARLFGKTRSQSGFPYWLYYNNNKNSGDANYEIAYAFREAGLLTKYVLSLQHLDEEVLGAIERTNLPHDRMVELVHRLHAIDYPLFVQLIAGCPGDTWDKWLRAFTDLMEMGVHGEYRAYPFGLFPNAPAADSAYMDEWQIRTIRRPDFVAYFEQVMADPYTVYPWPKAPESEEDGYQLFDIDMSELVFPVKPWYQSKDEARRDKAYFDQMIQHNVPGERRAIFKRLKRHEKE